MSGDRGVCETISAGALAAAGARGEAAGLAMSNCGAAAGDWAGNAIAGAVICFVTRRGHAKRGGISESWEYVWSGGTFDAWRIRSCASDVFADFYDWGSWGDCRGGGCALAKKLAER